MGGEGWGRRGRGRRGRRERTRIPFTKILDPLLVWDASPPKLLNGFGCNFAQGWRSVPDTAMAIAGGVLAASSHVRRAAGRS